MKSQPNNSLKSRFATTFLRSLIKINNLSSHSPGCPREILRRRRRIKLAADYSIARAVRSPRAWKKAVLSRRTRRRRRWAPPALIRRSSGLQLRKYNYYRCESEAAAELEELVPGGQGMNLEILLEETSHYVKCLRAQVEAMTTILHFCSSTPST